MRLFWKSKKKTIVYFFLALFFIVGAVLLVDGTTAYAQAVDPNAEVCDFWCAPFKWLLYAVLLVFQVIASISLILFETVISADKISGPTGLLNTPAVYELWKFVRDFFNLFFILTLLFAAFSTIFQIEQFSIKKIFLNILLAALLVNFSFPVTRALIDAANVPMYFFASSISPQNASPGGARDTAFGQVLSASRLTDIIIPRSPSETPFMTLLIAIIFMFFFAISVAVLAVMMFVRLLALIILLVFSSVGFLFAAFPGLQKYSSQWWESFWKYSLFGPAAMLMLLVAVKFFVAVDQSGAFGASVLSVASNVTASGGQASYFQSLVLFALPIILIWFSIGLANSFSIAGAGAITGWGQKMASWAWKAPLGASWWATKWAGRKVDTNVLAPRNLSPKAWIRGAKQYFETQKHEDELPIEMAKARMHNQMNNVLGRLPWAHVDRTDYEFLEQNAQKKKYEDEIKERSGGELNENVVRLALREGIEENSAPKILAAATLLSRINGLDNIAADFANDPRFHTAVMDARPAGGPPVLNIQASYAPTMNAILEQAGLDERARQMHMHNFGENAKSKGDTTFGDLYEPNVHTGEWGPVVDHPGTVAANFRKMKAQTRQDIIHPRALFTQYVVNPATGERAWGDLHPEGIQQALSHNADDVNSSNRKRADLERAYRNAVEGAANPATRANYGNFIAVFNDPANQEFRNYVWRTLGHPAAVAPPAAI